MDKPSGTHDKHDSRIGMVCKMDKHLKGTFGEGHTWVAINATGTDL